MAISGCHRRVHRRTRTAGQRCSWLNLVEVFFSVITRQAITRGTYTSVADLIDAIEAFIDGWNEHPKPFAWTKDPDQLLAKIDRAKTRGSAITVH